MSVASEAATIRTVPETSSRSRLFAHTREIIRNPSVRKTGISIFDQALVSGTNFATSVMIGRACAPEDLGIYSLAMTIVVISIGIQCELVSTPYTIYCHRRDAKQLRSYSGSAMLHLVAISSLAVLALLGALVWGGGSLGQTSLAAFAMLMWAGPMLMLREFLRQYSFARLQQSHALLIDVVIAIMQVGTLFLIIQTVGLSVPWVFATSGTASALAAILWYWLHRDDFQFSYRAAIADWWHNWSFSRWTLATYLVGCTTPFIMPWVLAALHGEAATGIFAACSTLIGLSYMFVTGVTNFLTAKASQSYARDGMAALRKVLGITVLMLQAVLIPFCIVTWFAGEWMLTFVYGDDFGGYGLVSFVVALGILVNAVGITAGNGLLAIERPNANLWADVATLATTAIAAALLVPEYAVIGAAWSTLIGLAIGMVIRVGTLLRLMALPRYANTPASREAVG